MDKTFIFYTFLATVFFFSTLKKDLFFCEAMRGPLILLHVVVLRFLVMWGRWRMGVIPFMGVIVLGIWYYQRQQEAGPDVRISLHDMLESYGVMIAWTVLLIGIWQLLSIFGLVTYSTGFRLLGGHMLLYLSTTLLANKDLAMIAHVGWRVSGGLVVFQASQFHDRGLVADMVSMMISLSFALYACIVFVFGTMGIKIDRRLPALLFIFSQLTVLVGVIYYANTLTLWTVLGGQIYLGVLYGVLQWIYLESKLPFEKSDHESEDLLQVILRGEQIQEQRLHVLEKQSGSLRELFLHIGNEIVRRLPAWSFRVLASINLLFMSLQLILILSGKTGDTGVWIDIGFRVSIGVYVMNYFVLQQQRIEVRGQRAMTFFLINFGIYLTIYHIFGNVPIYLVGCGVMWSLCNAAIMIHLRSSLIHTLLTEKDYQYRLFGNMVAIGANSYFMFLLPMSLQLRFTLVMIYLALQALLLKYQLASIKHMHQNT